ncbi:MAG: (2Fe-2S)-binding protein [Halopseudomonas sp.]
MFRSLCDSNVDLVQIEINGHCVSVPARSSVWTAMALVGETTTRLDPITETPRSAYCAMGVCFECLVQINGLPNQQACLTEVHEGMSIQLQTITESSQASPNPSAAGNALSVPEVFGGNVDCNVDGNRASEVSGHE